MGVGKILIKMDKEKKDGDILYSDWGGMEVVRISNGNVYRGD